MPTNRYDIVVVGGGTNGLAAALRLVRAGLKVLVLEEKSSLGGACKTEQPFLRAPTQRASTGAYLLGVMPPEIISGLGLESALYPLLVKRRPHYFLPTLGTRSLLLGDPEAAAEQIERFFSAGDASAYQRMCAELSMLRDDLAPSWLSGQMSAEDTAERFVRPELQQIFINLVRDSVHSYLARFGFVSDLLVAMFAVTDGLSGVLGSPYTPGTGLNFLIHNMCRLPGSDGTWMRVAGGMGTVTSALVNGFQQNGGEIHVSSKVSGFIQENNAVTGVLLADQTEIRARAVLVNSDPTRLLNMAGALLPPSFHQRISAVVAPGSTLKVNLCLKELPTFTCLPEYQDQCQGTVHIIPGETNPLQMLETNYQTALKGGLPDLAAIEWYFDRELQDNNGNFSSALFVPGMPYAVGGDPRNWDVHRDGYADHLLELCERYAPGTSSLVVDRFVLAPPDIERHFGITGGQIHHIPNTVGFLDRLPYRLPIPGLYAAGAGCHPGGSVTGAAGFNCAAEVLRDLGLVG